MKVIHKATTGAPAVDTDSTASPDRNTEITTPAVEKKSLYTRFREFLSSRLGGVNITRPEMEEVSKQQAGEDFKSDLPLRMYKITIYTGAGNVRMGIEATSKKEAEDRALVDYVRRLTVKAELI